MIRKYTALLIAVVLSFAVLCSCSKKEKDGVYKFIGDYSYSDPAVCMVYEPVEDEVDDKGNPYYGIQYRQIKDLDGLMNSGTVIMIYFYSSMSSEASAVTAMVEDLAQSYNGRLTVVMLDSMEYRDYVTKYGVSAIPEFVVVIPGKGYQAFGSDTYEYWTISDVAAWLKSNGIT